MSEVRNHVERDPAVAAAQRAWGFEADWEFNDKTTGGMSVAAAREALKPIRELHRPVKAHGTGRRVCHYCWDASGEYASWPCATARLVYTSDELGEMS